VGTRTESVLIRIFDMSGHWIATLMDGPLDPGDHTIDWARTNRDGRQVGPGYYEAIGSVGDARVRERIVLVP
jgi:flagellar hook assembly protein FlgD